MNTRKWKRLLILSFMLVMLFSLPAFADDFSYPCLIEVGQNESIQEAVDQATATWMNGNGCTIWVAKGVYTEDIEIGANRPDLKNVTIVGAGIGKTIIQGSIVVHYFQESGDLIDGGITRIKDLTLDGEGIRDQGLVTMNERVVAESVRLTRYAQYAVGLNGVTTIELDHCVIDRNQIGVHAWPAPAHIMAVNNTIVYNGTGLYLNSHPVSDPVSSTYATVVNNIFAFNQDGIFTTNHPAKPSKAFVKYNDFFKNQNDIHVRWPEFPSHIEGDPNTNLHLDPQFVNNAGDYRLRHRSPCIDAGDPLSPRDSDGTRANMGALLEVKPRLIHPAPEPEPIPMP